MPFITQTDGFHFYLDQTVLVSAEKSLNYLGKRKTEHLQLDVSACIT